MTEKDTCYLRELRELSCIDDFSRPRNERYLTNFYTSFHNSSVMDVHIPLPHSDVFYVRAALESRFPNKKFTIEEVKQLIKEEYGVDY